jgi:hypothetical protein
LAIVTFDNDLQALAQLDQNEERRLGRQRALTQRQSKIGGDFFETTIQTI